MYQSGQRAMHLQNDFSKWLRKKNNPALLTGDAVFTKVSSRGFTFVYMGPDMENRASHLYQGMDLSDFLTRRLLNLQMLHILCVLC